MVVSFDGLPVAEVAVTVVALWVLWVVWIVAHGARETWRERRKSEPAEEAE